MTRRAAFVAAAALSQAFLGAAAAQQAAPVFAAPSLGENGVRSMAANCAPCHGAFGRPVRGSSVAPLAGRKDVAERMKAFKDGKRDSTVMQQIARAYGDSELDALGTYFAMQAR